jgi:hypothetical protein
LFELLSQVIDVLLKGSASIDAIKVASKKSALRRLANSLYLSHAALVNVWDCGEDLIEIGQKIRDRAEKEADSSASEDKEEYFYELQLVRSSMTTMADNLRHASSLLYELTEFASLIDPGWKRELQRLMGGKANLIDCLSMDLASDLLPVSASVKESESWNPIRLSGSTTWKPEQLEMNQREIEALAMHEIATRLDFDRLQQNNDLFKEGIAKLGTFIAVKFDAADLLNVDLSHLRQYK